MFTLTLLQPAKAVHSPFEKAWSAAHDNPFAHYYCEPPDYFKRILHLALGCSYNWPTCFYDFVYHGMYCVVCRKDPGGESLDH